MSSLRFVHDCRDGYHVFTLRSESAGTARGNVALLVARQTRAAEIAAWCIQEFGPNGPTAIWAYSRAGAFFFNDETHAILFKMRWC